MTSKSGAKPKLSFIVAIHKSTKTFISLIHTSNIRVILTAQKHRNLSMKWKLKVKNGNRTKSRNYTNYAYNEEITYRKSSFGKGFKWDQGKRIGGFSTFKSFVNSQKTVNIDEIIFYLTSMCSTHNEEPRTFISDILTWELSFKAITNYQGWWKYEFKKTSVYLADGFLMASKVYRKENLYCLCKIKKQTSYNYRNLFKLMGTASKLINCKTNAKYFVKNH